MNAAGTVEIKARRAKPLWCGHPLVYSGAVARVEGVPRAGEMVRVCDYEGKEIGTGVYNPHSDYRVRMLVWRVEGAEDEDVRGVVARRLRAAREMRAGLGLPSERTSVYRLLNSEGDRCSGLTVDCFHAAENVERCVVAVSSSAWWTEQYRAEICGAIEEVVWPEQICWRQSRAALAQDGWKEFREEAGRAPRVMVSEHGLRYVTEPGMGQKTGFYCDQRENRQLVRGLARGRRVLDAYCYTGGFALNAAAGGAASVVGVDSSERALALARENAALNGFEQVRFERGDARAVLARGGEYDMIILDPPKLAATRHEVEKAVRAYRGLCADAARRLGRHGVLVVSSCSAAIGAEELRQALREGGVEAGRQIAVLAETHAGPDHPVLAAFPEGQYLTCLVCVV